MWITVALLGLAGGVVSTLVGFGAGMILAIALALTVPPLTALAVASCALFTGSLHRVMLFRRELRASDAYRWALAVLLGSVAGGALVHHLPEWLLRASFVAGASFALIPARWLPTRRRRDAPHVLVPAGGAIGFLGAGAAGVGPLASSTLLATGHAGERYIALMSVTGVALNAGRVLGYGSSGSLDPSWLSASAAGAAGLLGGNLLGRALRHRITSERMQELEHVVPWGCLVLAVLGLLR